MIALPWSAVETILSTLGDLSGKIIIDVTNAMTFGASGLMEMAIESSAGEMIQQWLPDSIVVKAFNTVGFHVIANPAAAGGPVSVPIVADDAEAKATVAEIVQSVGF